MGLLGNDLLNKARECIEKDKDLDIAEENLNLLLNESIHQKCDVATLLFYLGCVHTKRGHHAHAILLLKESLEYKKDLMGAINNLGVLYKNEQITDEAIKCFDRVLVLAKKQEEKGIPQELYDKWLEDKADYLANKGSTLIANGTSKESIKYFDKALDCYKDHVTSKWNRSLAYLELGDYEKGFDEYDNGQRMDKTATRFYGVKNLPLWDGTPNKTIVIFGEQGIGDEIMFASMIPDAMKDCNIILDAHPRLADLFRLNFPTIPIYGTRKQDDSKIGWSKYHKIDAKISMGSLGKFYRKKESDFPKNPYLVANPEIVEKYRLKLSEMSNKPKIGISWQGGMPSTNGANRFIPLNQWLDILRIKDFDFISLQYTKNIGDAIKHFEDTNNLCINHWQDTLDDYDETAGLVSNLDLIISIPQSVVHLAGALGTATWQLTPYKSMWQMGVHGKDMPWYGCVRSIWQDEKCDWKPVLKTVKDDLCNLYQMSIGS
jgi:tetratricopeptide (TPR) repeat protein